MRGLGNKLRDEQQPSLPLQKPQTNQEHKNLSLNRHQTLRSQLCFQPRTEPHNAEKHRGGGLGILEDSANSRLRNHNSHQFHFPLCLPPLPIEHNSKIAKPHGRRRTENLRELCSTPTPQPRGFALPFFFPSWNNGIKSQGKAGAGRISKGSATP